MTAAYSLYRMCSICQALIGILYLLTENYSSFTKLGTYPAVGVVVRTEQSVEMNAACEGGEGRGGLGLELFAELHNVVARAELKPAGYLSINRVLNDNVQHGAAVIDHNIQLIEEQLHIMNAGDGADKP